MPKQTVRSTIKEVSILIYYQDENYKLFTEEHKIGFNETLQIDPKFENKIIRVMVSSFEVIKDA